jgi:DNA-binding transcriptional MerR regulator
VTSDGQYISPAQTARQLGVSVRALRLYERRGLLTPVRTYKGWRAYGPEQIARLHQVLALKGLGLSLSDIADVLENKAVDLSRILALQRDVLTARRAQIEAALKLVDAACGNVAAGRSVTTTDLITLIKETNMSDLTWAEALKPYVKHHFDADDVKNLRALNTPEMISEAKAEMPSLIAELNRLVAEGAAPDAPQSRGFAKRWVDASDKIDMGGEALKARAKTAMAELFDNPDAAQRLPFSPAGYAFLKDVTQRERSSRKA